MHCGDTIKMSRVPHSTPHLWILITEPEASTRDVVIVNITTLRPHHDQTVVLRRGDHPYIRHDSVVFFQDARITKDTAIEAGIRGGVCQDSDPCSPEVIEKIKQGLLTSKFTPNKVLDFCRRLWGL